MYECKVEARSLNRCCCGKTINITYCECVFVSVGIQHPMRMCHISVCGLPRSQIFFDIITQYCAGDKMRWAGHVARMGEKRGCIGSWWGNRREGITGET